MRSIILLMIFVITLPVSVLCGGLKSEIEVQKREKWWGVFVNDAPTEPFAEPFSIETKRYSRNGAFTSSMLVSSDGRYIWSPNPMTIDFTPEKISVLSQSSNVAAQKAGKNLREAYLVCCHKNFPPSGKTPPIELFTRPVYEIGGELGYVHNQRSVIEYADRIISEGFPLGTIVISDGWRSMNGAYDFDRDYYHDPRTMMDELHRKGFKVMLTITPFVPASGRSFVSYMQQGYLLSKEDRKPLIVENDGGYSACMDVSKRGCIDMIAQRLNFIRDTYGVDGFRFDARALMPHLDRLGKQEQFMESWIEVGKNVELAEYSPAINRQLSPYVNCFMVGDKRGLESMQEEVNGIVSSGLSGFLYSHIVHSNSGARPAFEGQDEELMARRLQLSAFMPVPGVSFAPWRIRNKGLLEEVKRAFAFRMSIETYIRATIEESAKTAEPLIRSMEYQFPRNGFADCNDQFMLGDKYLVVVVVDPDAKRMVRLPKGIWADMQGRKYRGPLVTNVDVSAGKFVYFELTSK